MGGEILKKQTNEIQRVNPHKEMMFPISRSVLLGKHTPVSSGSIPPTPGKMSPDKSTTTEEVDNYQDRSASTGPEDSFSGGFLGQRKKLTFSTPPPWPT